MDILLVEDEIKIAEFVLHGLAQAGCQVTHVQDGLTGWQALQNQKFDVVVMDIMLPYVDGFELLKALRQANNLTPVIVLSAKSELSDRLQGFESGANDYLAKPFFIEELLARIKVQAKNAPLTEPVQELVVDDLHLDLVNRRVTWHEVTALLSPREFMLLDYLMRSPGQIISRTQILQNVWGIHFDPQTNLIDVSIQRIKRKLFRKESEKDYPIESVRGVGYRIRRATRP